MSDAVSLLCDLIGTGDVRIGARAYADHQEAFAALVHSGILTPDGVIESTVCDACDNHHLADVVPKNDGSGHGWHCPEVGFVLAVPAAISAFAGTMGRVVAGLSRALTSAYGTPRLRPHLLAEDDLWLVGVWEVAGVSTTVAAARKLSSAEALESSSEVLSKVTRFDAGLLLTMDENVHVDPAIRFKAVPLTAAIRIDVRGALSVAEDVLAHAVAIQSSYVASKNEPRGVGTKVFAVLRGLELEGAISKVTSRVIADNWKRFASGKIPSSPTIRRHIQAWRRQG
jgi:hypothetical protein